MDKRLGLVYNLIAPAQLFELYPPEGVPAAAATYSVWPGFRGDDEAAEFSGTATMDTYSQAPSAASGYTQANRRRVNIATTTGLAVGRLVVLENVLGQKEVAKVTAIAAASYFEVEYDLAYDYTTTSTVKGFRQTFSPPDVFVQNESKINSEAYPYRIRWSYTVAGVAGRNLQYFDLLRHAEQPGLVDDDVKNTWPDSAYMMDADRRQRIMGEAHAELDKDLRLRGLDPALIAPQSVRTQLLKNCFTYLAVRSGAAIPQGHDAASALRTATRSYLDGLELAVQAGKLLQTQNRGDDNVNANPQPKLLLIS